MSGLGHAPVAEDMEPAVSIRSSIKPDYIVCLEDGKKLKMLKRHLMTHYAMTPAQYRAKWHLPSDYPMVAPNYAEQRRMLANKIGLGHKPNSPALLAVPVVEVGKAKSSRKAAAAPAATRMSGASSSGQSVRPVEDQQHRLRIALAIAEQRRADRPLGG